MSLFLGTMAQNSGKQSGTSAGHRGMNRMLTGEVFLVWSTMTIFSAFGHYIFRTV